MERIEAGKIVRAVLCEELGLPEDGLTDAASLRDDLGMDSLDRLELVSLLESRLGASVPQTDLSAVRTLGDVIDLVAQTGSG